MNLMWPTWIKASIAQHCKTNLSDYGVLYLEGVDDNKGTTFPRFEIRIDGPSVNEIGTVIWLDVYVNILIVSKRSNDAYLHERLIGAAIVALENNISIFEYTESGNLVFCMMPEADIITTNYGEIMPIEKIVQTTVEREFKILI